MKKIQSILIGSFLAVTIPFLLSWIYNTFVIGLNAFLGYVIICLILVIMVPIILVVLKRVKMIGPGKMGFTPSILFAIGCVSWFILGLFFAVFKRRSTFDFQVKDTYFVIALIYVMIAVSVFLGMLGAIYHWFPKISGRYLNSAMSYIHFWVTFSGAYFIFWPSQYSGFSGLPMRYIDYSNWGTFNQAGGLNQFVSMVAIAMLAAQFIFLFNLFYTIVNGRRVAAGNR